MDVAFGAYQRGDYATALAEAKKRLAANPKDATAMTLIGRLYSEGAGVKRDRKLGLDWMRRAAEAGGAEAAYLYGAAVLLGAEIPENRNVARAYLEKAATLDHPAALNLLGEIALDNDGVTPDFKAALDYFQRAAAAGDPDAFYALGKLYKSGKGVDMDAAQAASWFEKGAEAGNIPATVELAILEFNGVGVAKDETAAAGLFRTAAQAGNAVAQNRLAYLLAQGRGRRKSGRGDPLARPRQGGGAWRFPPRPAAGAKRRRRQSQCDAARRTRGAAGAQMTALALPTVNAYLRRRIKPRLAAAASLDAARDILDLRPPSGPPPGALRRACFGGVAGDLVSPPGGAGPTLLCLHGGAYFAGSPEQYRPISFAFARQGFAVLVPAYRLAPFPAPLDDVRAVYAALAAAGQPIFLAGNSAGGGLALALMLASRDAGALLPRAAALFSPWTDLPSPAPRPSKMREATRSSRGACCDWRRATIWGATMRERRWPRRCLPISRACRPCCFMRAPPKCCATMRCGWRRGRGLAA